MSIRQETMEETMGTVANRTAALTHTLVRPVQVCALLIALAACFAGPHAYAQAPANPPASPKPPAPATYSGCVQKAPDSTDLVLSTPKVCALLTGKPPAKLSVDVLAGHQVELTGILTPRTSSAAASIEVHSLGSVGNACSETCALHPPLSRGLHKPTDSAVPGTEGGTPGLTTTPPQ
jgi:hypothetical protein